MLAGRLLQASVPVEGFAFIAGKRARPYFQKGEKGNKSYVDLCSLGPTTWPAGRRVAVPVCGGSPGQVMVSQMTATTCSTHTVDSGVAK